VVHAFAQRVAEDAFSGFATVVRGEGMACESSRLASVLIFSSMHFFRAEPEIVQRHADDAAEHGEIANPLRRPLPELHHPRNVRIFRQSAIRFRIGHIVQHIDDAGSAHARRIVDARFLDAVVLAKLPARVSARSFMSSLLPKCRQPVGQDLMQAGSSPSLTRSTHSVHLNIFLVWD
jgi:hypothetical protein